MSAFAKCARANVPMQCACMWDVGSGVRIEAAVPEDASRLLVPIQPGVAGVLGWRLVSLDTALDKSPDKGEGWGLGHCVLASGGGFREISIISPMSAHNRVYMTLS